MTRLDRLHRRWLPGRSQARYELSNSPVPLLGFDLFLVDHYGRVRHFCDRATE